QAEDGIRDWSVTGVQTCALPISETYYDLWGGATGAGGKARVQWGMQQCADFLKPHTLAQEKLIDTFGFSRGAAIARDFFNTVLKIGRASCRERVKRSGAGVYATR